MARQTTHQTEPNKPKNVKRDPIASGERDATFNRAASHNYFLEDKMEAGIVLTGSEVKSVRAGRANLKDGYALLKDGELWLLNAHIGAYENAGYAGHTPLRTRKLLVHGTNYASSRPRPSKKATPWCQRVCTLKTVRSNVRSLWPKANKAGTNVKLNAVARPIRKLARPLPDHESNSFTFYR